MRRIAAWFFGSAVVYGIVGLVLGNYMAISQDHVQMPTHAHIMVIGWVSFALFGLFYQLFPEAAHGWPAMTHLLVAEFSFLALALGLFFIFAGDPATGEALAAPASLIYLASMVLFALIAWPVVRGRG
jgi:predicted membrane channel-forming protein YqfA (hemolysin III family)